ncbi:MAG: glycosyltransferase family 2 protein [Gemmatimonadota bacterium]|nr:glycosyltransferase family 2 protein [Gemmatimonadota bacterium]
MSADIQTTRIRAASHREQADRRVLSVVVPVFNEEAVLPAFFPRVTEALAPLEHWDLELVFVDDGSSDATFDLLQDLARRDGRVKVLRFSRNFGHQIAITAGVDHASGDAVAVIDADLQDPPEVLVEMVARLEEGYDVVYGQRVDRKGETRLKLWTAAVFYRLLKRLVKIEIPVDVGDFRLMSRRAVLELRTMREKDRFVRGLVSWVGFRQIGVPYRREARFAGATKYPVGKMLKFALDGITSFSTVPLKLATWLGYAASAFAFLYLASVFVQKAFGVTVEGWATIMVAMLFMGGVQLICLGILGEYIGRIFNEIKPRPMYVVAERLNLEPGSAPARPQPHVVG